MAAKSRIVKWQKIREVKTKKKYNGESSPYWEAMQKASRANSDHDTTGETGEYPTSNPDVLPELDAPEENLMRKIIKRDWREIKFSKREQEVLVRLAKGMTQEEVAKDLRINRSSVRVLLLRIQKKSSKWLVTKTANSGLYSTEEETE